MSHRHTRFASLTTLASFAFVATLAAAQPARAETSATCAGYIDSLPATISTPGTWCLRGDLGTALATGHAISIDSNNVTLDCNGYKIGGLGAGPGTRTMGVVALNRLNATVRNCSIRGFAFGTYLHGGGHAVLDSRFDQNTHVAVFVQGGGLSVRGNRVLDTGGSTAELLYGSAMAIGLWIDSDGVVADNAVHDTTATAGRGGSAVGILHYMTNGSVHDNVVAGLVADGEATVRGISGNMQGSRASVRGNHVSAGGWTPVAGTGIQCFSPFTVIKDNVVNGITGATNGCHDGGGNATL